MASGTVPEPEAHRDDTGGVPMKGNDDQIWLSEGWANPTESEDTKTASDSKSATRPEEGGGDSEPVRRRLTGSTGRSESESDPLTGRLASGWGLMGR